MGLGVNESAKMDQSGANGQENKKENHDKNGYKPNSAKGVGVRGGRIDKKVA